MRYQDLMRSMQPLFYLPFGEPYNAATSSTRARDLSGWNRPGDWNGSNTTPGQDGALLVGGGAGTRFPGDGARFDVTGVTAFNSSNITIIMWVQRERSSTRELLMFRDNSPGTRYFAIELQANNTVRFTNYGTGATVDSTGTFTDTTRPHMLAITLSGGTAVVIYLDGAVIGSGTWSSAIPTTGNEAIGIAVFRTGTIPYQGKLGHVAYWAKVLSAGDVRRLYTAGRNGHQLAA